jgi:hypothetical protein
MSEQRKLETILLANKLVSGEQLNQIVSYAHAVGIDLCEAVLQKKVAPPEAVMMAYAESLGLPFVHFDDLSIDDEIVARVDPVTARRCSFVPISIDQGYVLLATTKPVLPDVADELRMIFNLPVRCVICTPAELSAAIVKYFPRDAARVTKVERSPEPVPVVKEKPKPVEPMNDGEKKDRIWKTIITFNFTFAFLVFFSSTCLPKGLVNSTPLLLLVCVIVSGVAAGIAWKTLSR